MAFLTADIARRSNALATPASHRLKHGGIRAALARLVAPAGAATGITVERAARLPHAC